MLPEGCAQVLAGVLVLGEKSSLSWLSVIVDVVGGPPWVDLLVMRIKAERSLACDGYWFVRSTGAFTEPLKCSDSSGDEAPVVSNACCCESEVEGCMAHDSLAGMFDPKFL